MFHSKPYKKDITAFAKGGKVVKHVGKGAREQSTRGGMQTMTGGDSFARMSNSYPKPPAADFSSGGGLGGPAAESSTPAPPVPTGSQPPGAPTAMMPGGIGEEEE